MKKIYLIGSSSGGHVFPLIGIYELLKNNYEINFIGIKNRFEENIFKSNSLFLDIPNSFSKIKKEKERFNKEINRIKKIINEDDLIISGGGISSYIAYKINKGKLILLEQNRIMGDSNLLSGLRANKILTSLDILINPYFYKTEKIINPSIYRIDKSNVLKEKLIIFIFGSLSSSTLLNKTIEYFLSKEFNDNYNYILVTGKNDIKNISLPKNIKLIEKIDDFSILKKAELVFSRAGGTTISELMYFNIPFITIPSPYVKHNHQLYNAKYLKKKYNIPFILEKDFNKKTIIEYISDFENKKIKYRWNNLDKYGKTIKEIIDEMF